MIGINFSCYYLLLVRKPANVLRDEELRTYIAIVLSAIILITINLRDYYAGLGDTIRHAAFQVSSIITTTGFATADFNDWPSFSQTVLLMLMVIGSCAGSTGGGLKVARGLILIKNLSRNIKQIVRPRQVLTVRNNKHAVDERIVTNANAYLAAYVIILMISFLVISIDGFSIETNVSAVLSCFNNIGPGLDMEA